MMVGGRQPTMVIEHPQYGYLFRLFVTFACVVLFFGFSEAQYIQNLQYVTLNGQLVPHWRPTISSPLKEVIDTKTSIWLEYNCDYMTAICQNARNYFNSAAGQGRRFQTLFSYDFTSSRSKKRRRKSCPTGRTGWKSYHTCPETNQPRPWRNDGQWPETKLEANPLNALFREVSGYTDVNGQYQRSGLQYSCDEFPPAAWVEGGSGTLGQNVQPEGDGGPVQTYCAAIRICIKGQGLASEQNWQGNLHAKLSDELKSQYSTATGAAPGDGDTASFSIRLVNNPGSGIAGRVRWFNANGGVDEKEQALYRRGGDRNILAHLAWMDTVDLETLEGLGEHVIYANETLVEYDMDFEDDDDEDLPLDQTNIAATYLSVAGNASSHGSLLEAPEAKPIPEPVIPAMKRWDAFGLKKVVRRNSSEPVGGEGDGPLLQNATLADIDRARKLIAQAIVELTKHNKERIANPARNQYKLSPNTKFSASAKARHGVVQSTDPDPAPPPLYNVTDEVQAAAALLAEADAAGVGLTNLTRRHSSSRVQKRGTFWMETITRRGTVPWGNDLSYKVFRNVKDYGAKGDGLTDDTIAIRTAMTDGNRCGENCNGATINNALVYFPPGTYLVSGTIQVLYGTQMVGDANDRPTIQAAASFVGLGVLSTDEYVDGGGTGADGKDMEWYINTASFYRQIRNFKIDITLTAAGAQVCGIHYQIAQATSLQFVEIIAKPGTTQQGMCKLTIMIKPLSLIVLISNFGNSLRKWQWWCHGGCHVYGRQIWLL